MATKRALLIASPFGGLQGPQNDVDRMAKALSARHFEIEKCCGKDATREGILAAWQDIINKSLDGDAVVIFYSGHGGLVKPPRKPETESTPKEDDATRRMYKFLLPTDFGETRGDDFRGILDVELSQLLRDTTKKTINVTVILDCCHSGRMARDSIHGDNATPKQLPKQLLHVKHHDIESFVKVLEGDGRLHGELAAEANPNAVRIVACTERETAWEYLKDDEWGGVFTEALSAALRDAEGQTVSWSTLLLRVAEQVQAEFPQQNPHAEGPHTRECFSTTPMETKAFRVKMEGETPILYGGQVVGVREGNEYAVMPLDATGIDKKRQIAVAKVTKIIGFKSRVELDFGSAGGSLPANGALAFLSQEALYEWPVLLPHGIPVLEERVGRSRFLRRHNGSEKTHLADFQYEDGKVILHTEAGVQIASQQIPDAETAPDTAFDCIISAAEVLAKAQHFLGLKCENEEELLSHGLKVEFSRAEEGGAEKPIPQDGTGLVRAGDKVVVRLRNTGESTIFVSVFDVNVAGKIALLSNSAPKGLELKATSKPYTLGRNLLGAEGEGTARTVSWPDNVPGSEPIGEHISFVVSDAQVDLRHVETSKNGTARLAEIESRGPDSRVGGLEERTYRLASGGKRDTEAEGGECPRYDVFNIPFTMLPAGQHIIPAEQLPTPETITTEGSELAPSHQPNVAQKGIIAGAFRALQGIPACVWVVNEHSEQIAVVVSKYRPNRMLSGLGANASSTGAGVNYTTVTFLSPATTKILAPASAGLAISSAMFPLWTRAGAFGVISIFTGPDKELFIENDRIPIGATAYFRNEPNLTIVEY